MQGALPLREAHPVEEREVVAPALMTSPVVLRRLLLPLATNECPEERLFRAVNTSPHGHPKAGG